MLKIMKASISSVLRSILVRFWTCYFWWDFDFLEGEYLELVSTSIERSKNCNDEITIFIPLSEIVILSIWERTSKYLTIPYYIYSHMYICTVMAIQTQLIFGQSFCPKRLSIENGHVWTPAGHFGEVVAILKITANFDSIILKARRFLKPRQLLRVNFETSRSRTDTIGCFDKTI